MSGMLRRCRRDNEVTDDVIMIDVDSGQFDNIIIVDVPKCSSKKEQGSSMLDKDKKRSFRNVVFIIDDDESVSFDNDYHEFELIEDPSQKARDGNFGIKADDSTSRGINGDDLPQGESSIINGRERLKETDEYKRALEEEWASRKKALQIQADEAKHQRQLLRRQKQRVEDLHNTQKKDEEHMHLKETIRTEIRNELKKVEISCHNLASVLHSLGIRVDGWPYPSRQEVQAAYKRALLRFHPDRALRSDIRQQVTAEEIFKLINRMKDKFSPS